MSRIWTLLIALVILFVTTNVAEAEACAARPGKICDSSFLFSKKLDVKEEAKVRHVVRGIVDIFASQNITDLVAHESATRQKEDERGIQPDESAFLYGEDPSKYLSRKSVRQILLESKKLRVYVEPHDVWESYKGDLYVVIFFDADKISFAKISKDLGGNRLHYMNFYAATLIQLKDDTWLFPESPFFWETDGP